MSTALAGGFFTTEPPGKASLSVLYVDIVGLPRWHNGKEFTCQCRRHKRCRFNPWVAKIPWRRKWQPTPVFLPRKFHGQRSLVGYNPWGRKESDTIGQLTVSLHFSSTLKKKLLEVSCFTVLYWFLPYINMNQLHICLCHLPLESASHLPPHPTPLGCHKALD